ncbi:MAG: putative phage tail protein [Negativicutes bacterium]
MYSARGQQMYEYLSWYYRNSRVMQTVLDSQGVEIDAARNTLEESLNQFYAAFVGDWGIEYWEKELAITPPANASLEAAPGAGKSKAAGR